MRYATLRTRCAVALALAFAAVVTPARAQAVTVIEYYNVALDHYFITSLQPDIDALDSGHFFGWSRTGLTFQAFADQASDERQQPVQPDRRLRHATDDFGCYSDDGRSRQSRSAGHARGRCTGVADDPRGATKLERRRAPHAAAAMEGPYVVAC